MLQNGVGLLALTKMSGGVLTLTGANTATGATTVSAGVLAVDGGYASAIAVQSGATLRGTGTDTAGATVQSGATFAPGDATGVFTSAGLSFAANSTFAESITGAGANGRATVTGAVDLTNATLSVNYTGGAANAGQFTLLTAGAVTGHFADAATDGATVLSNGHTFQVHYITTSVTLTDLTAQATLTNTTAAQSSVNGAAVTPFSGASVSDPNQGATDTLTITPSGNGGVLSYNGAALTAANGAYTITGSAQAVTAELQALSFAPAKTGVPDGSLTTTFALSDTSSLAPAGSAPATAASSTVTETDGSVAPTLTPMTTSLATSNEAVVRPFAAVTVGDANAAAGGDTASTAVDTLTITQSGGAGVLAGNGLTPGAAAGTYTLTGTAAQVTAQLEALTFTAAPGAPNASATTRFALGDASAVNATHATATVTVTDSDSATGSTILNTTPAQASANGAAVRPFANATVTDPNVNATDMLTITPSTAGGTFATGAALPAGTTAAANADGTFTIAGSAANVTAVLDALTYAPAKAGVANGSVTTTFVLSDANSASATAATDNTSRVTERDAAATPTITGAGAVSTTYETAVKPFAAVTVSDPNSATGQDTAASATDTLTITQSGAGGTLTGAGLMQTGANTYTLTGTAASVSSQLHGLAFTPGAQGTTTFTLGDASAAGTTGAPAMVVVTDSDPVGGGGSGGAQSPTNLDAQQGFPTQFDNLVRAVLNDAAFSTPTSPLYAAAQAEKGIAAQLDSGQLGLADAQSALHHLVDGTTSVAEIDYAFFTGKTPSAAGLDYLVHSSANATDLNDPYYAQFTTENRYINFAVNLATGVGAGAAQFQAAYGALSLSDAVTKAYQAVFGIAPAAGKVDAILNASVSNGLGGTETRAQYFSDITGGAAAAQKAAAIGFLLADSVKEGFGAYQQADLHFLADLAHGTAVFNVDLLAAYTQTPALVGQPVVEPTLGS